MDGTCPLYTGGRGGGGGRRARCSGHRGCGPGVAVRLPTAGATPPPPLPTVPPTASPTVPTRARPLVALHAPAMSWEWAGGGGRGRGRARASTLAIISASSVAIICSKKGLGVTRDAGARRVTHRRMRRMRARRGSRVRDALHARPPFLPYKVDTSGPSLRTNWTRLNPSMQRLTFKIRARLLLALWASGGRGWLEGPGVRVY